MFWPAVGPVALAATATGMCALALARRPSRGLRVALAAIAVWIGGGVAGALALAEATRAGFTFLLVVLFAAPALVIPWIYARTFAAGGDDDNTGARSIER